MFFLAAASAHAGTNTLWDQPFQNLPTNALSITEWMTRIQEASAQVDPTGVGLQFVDKTTPWNTPSRVPFRMIVTNKLSFAQVLDALECCTSTKFRKVDNTVVIGNHQFRYLLLAYSGRCVDSETKKPITNLSVRAEGSVFHSQFMTVDADGHFTCGIPHKFDFIALPDAVFTDDDFPFTTNVATISAPGYHNCTVTNNIWDWRHSWGESYLNVELRKKREVGANKTSPPYQ